MIYQIIVYFFSILIVITVISIFIYIVNTRSKLIKLEDKINNNNLQDLIDDMNYNNKKLSQENNELEKIQDSIIDNVNKEIKELTKPIDCETSGWNGWTDCTKECETGTQTNTRTIITPPQHGGKECGELHQTQECNTQPCPIDCDGSWSDSCTNSILNGVNSNYKTFNIITPSNDTGIPCPHTQGEKNIEGCDQPIDCEGQWSVCQNDNSDGHNINYKTYEIKTYDDYHGKKCPYSEGDTTPEGCEQPQNCIGEWSDCTPMDTEGYSYKTYHVNIPPNNHGQVCSHSEGETSTISCEQGVKTDCEGAWTSCSYDSNTNRYTKTYRYTHDSAYGGQDCVDSNGIKISNHQKSEEGCQQPIDCVGHWDNNCIYNDSNHSNEQHYKITTLKNKFHGKDCPYNEGQSMTEECDQPIDCKEGNWDSWTNCTALCGGGTHTQTRTDTPAQHNGNPCSLNTKTESCNTMDCIEPINATVIPSDSSTIYKYTGDGDGNITFNKPIDNIDVLLVGGGGGGGTGGGGGVIHKTLNFNKGTYNIIVGNGGSVGSNGGNTRIYNNDFNLQAGGGGGGCCSSNQYGGGQKGGEAIINGITYPGGNGGIGGPGYRRVGGPAKGGKSTGAGGGGSLVRPEVWSGYGGGADTDATFDRPGDGVKVNILGEEQYYGGGGSYDTTISNGGGGSVNSNAEANTGGGSGSGGSGASGIVVIKVPI